MKRAKNKRGSSSHRPRYLEVLRIYAPNETFKKLPIEDQYCLLLFGHIQHEISWLERAAHISINTPDSGGSVERTGKVMQTNLLLRLLLGKLNEFRVTAESNAMIWPFLEKWYDTEQPTVGLARVEDLKLAFGNAPWLHTARNKHFLHYPKFTDAKQILEDESIQLELEHFHAKRTSNTLYASSDAFAGLAWFRIVNADEPFVGFEAAMASTTKLSRKIRELVENSISNYVFENIPVEKKRLHVPVKYDLGSIEMPFFTHYGETGEE